MSQKPNFKKVRFISTVSTNSKDGTDTIPEEIQEILDDHPAAEFTDTSNFDTFSDVSDDELLEILLDEMISTN